MPVRDALLNLCEQLGDESGEAERVILLQANPYHYVARVYLTEEEEFDGYQIVLEKPSDPEA